MTVGGVPAVANGASIASIFSCLSALLLPTRFACGVFIYIPFAEVLNFRLSFTLFLASF
jgi:hypothetical protein